MVNFRSTDAGSEESSPTVAVAEMVWVPLVATLKLKSRDSPGAPVNVPSSISLPSRNTVAVTDEA